MMEQEDSEVVLDDSISFYAVVVTVGSMFGSIVAANMGLIAVGTAQKIVYAGLLLPIVWTASLLAIGLLYFMAVAIRRGVNHA